MNGSETTTKRVRSSAGANETKRWLGPVWCGRSDRAPPPPLVLGSRVVVVPTESIRRHIISRSTIRSLNLTGAPSFLYSTTKTFDAQSIHTNFFLPPFSTPGASFPLLLPRPTGWRFYFPFENAPTMKYYYINRNGKQISDTIYIILLNIILLITLFIFVVQTNIYVKI